MVYCCFNSCRNASTKGFTMVRFPRDESLKRKWTVSSGRKNWVPTPHSRVCEVHFNKSDWVKFRCRLKADAIPNAFCTCPHANQENKGNQPRPLKLHHVYLEHSYCSPVIHASDCLQGELEERAAQVLSEHCILQSKLAALTAELRAKEEEVAISGVKIHALKSEKDNIEMATVLAFDKLKKAEEDGKPLAYTMADTKRGLQLQFSCGTVGYQKVSKLVAKQPDIRTLQRKTQHIKFNPGIQHDILQSLNEKLNHLSDERDRDCNIYFDEMAIKPRIDYDIGSKSYLGNATLAGHEGELACKGEVYMFGGIKKRWKQTVGYNFTGAKGADAAKRDVVVELLKEADKLKLNPIAIVCDMGNRGLLAALGFVTHKNEMKYCIPNPAKPSKKLWCFPDPVHLFKSLKEMICSNSLILIEKSMMEEFGLPSQSVKVNHIEWLEEWQRGQDLKFVPKLQLKDIKTNHFSKMNFKSAHNMLSHKTASTLSYLAVKGIVSPEFETTAWFVKVMNRWREIMTSRSRTFALSKKNPKAYEEAISHLKLVIRLFKSMKVQGGWKPGYS